MIPREWVRAYETIGHRQLDRTILDRPFRASDVGNHDITAEIRTEECESFESGVYGGGEDDETGARQTRKGVAQLGVSDAGNDGCLDDLRAAIMDQHLDALRRKVAGERAADQAKTDDGGGWYLGHGNGLRENLTAPPSACGETGR